MTTLRFIGSFIWVCIYGTLIAGFMVSALMAINKLGVWIERL